MKMRSMMIAGALSALLGLSPAAQADGGRGRPHWAPGPRHHAHHHHPYWHQRQHNRIRHQSYRRGYRDGYRDGDWPGGYWYTAPRYYGHSGYGLNVWLDGIGVSYWESGRYCH